MSARPILFFDGVCGLCDRFVTFLLRVDRVERFLVAPLQGRAASEALGGEASARPGSKALDLSSMIVKTAEGELLDRSSAVVYVLREIGGGWRALGVALAVVPRPLRDLGYLAVARSRYRVFGKRATCRIASASERDRFLE